MRFVDDEISWAIFSAAVNNAPASDVHIASGEAKKDPLFTVADRVFNRFAVSIVDATMPSQGLVLNLMTVTQKFFLTCRSWSIAKDTVGTTTNVKAPCFLPQNAGAYAAKLLPAPVGRLTRIDAPGCDKRYAVPPYFALLTGTLDSQALQ